MKKTIWAGLIMLLIGISAGLYFSSLKPKHADQGALSIEAHTSTPSDATVSKTTQEHENSADVDSVKLDTEAVLKERIIGDPNAPIRISEHSSFTCGHCGTFHKETFAALKNAYLDTGRAYLVFSDFPLNTPALHASMVTRCVPDEHYFDFVNHLFYDQENWAYETDYLQRLKKKAMTYGLNDQEFKTCIQSKDIQDGILSRMQAVKSQWDIRSTPSFVINNKIVVGGAMSFEEFDQAIQNALLELNQNETQNGVPDNARVDTQSPNESQAPSAIMREIKDMSEDAEEDLPPLSESTPDDQNP